MQNQAVLIALTCLAGSPAWAINRCTGPDGAIVFQDAPCADKGEKVRVLGAGQADPNSQGANYWKREAQRIERKERAEAAILQGQVFVGMTADEVRASWGNPAIINATLSGSGKSEQWVYRRAQHRDQYVYIRDGVVSTIQSPE